MAKWSYTVTDRPEIDSRYLSILSRAYLMYICTFCWYTTSLCPGHDMGDAWMRSLLQQMLIALFTHRS